MTEAMQLLLEQLVQNMSLNVSLKGFYYLNFSDLFHSFYKGVVHAVAFYMLFLFLVAIFYFVVEGKRDEIESKYTSLLDKTVCIFFAVLFVLFTLQISLTVYMESQSLTKEEKAVAWQNLSMKTKSKEDFNKELSISEIKSEMFDKEKRGTAILWLAKDNEQFSEGERKVINDCLKFGKQPAEVVFVCLENGLFELERSKAN